MNSVAWSTTESIHAGQPGWSGNSESRGRADSEVMLGTRHASEGIAAPASVERMILHSITTVIDPAPAGPVREQANQPPFANPATDFATSSRPSTA
jgi:hypothetical protein